jgi:hypothetical protein
MKIILLGTIAAFMLSPFCPAQVATIQDPDGWTNVRAEGDGEASVIHQIQEGELFWYDFEYRPQESDWIKVYVPTDRFCSDGYDSEEVVGFIHVSRLLALDSLVPYRGADFQFKYILSEYDSAGKDIQYHKGKWPVAINGKPMWGNDGYFPYSQIDDIQVTLANKPIVIDPALYVDLFNISTEFHVYKIKDLFVVYHWNSDGAGAYELAWAINKNGVVQRLVGTLL